MTGLEIATLILIAAFGHAMAAFWYLAEKFHWRICRDRIYAIPISREQIKRELRNSIHTPVHAVALFGFLLMNVFQGRRRGLVRDRSGVDHRLGGNLALYLT